MKPKQNQVSSPDWRAARHGVQLLMLTLLIICAGCMQEGRVSTEAKTVTASKAEINPAGTYALLTVDGKKVPCAVEHEGHVMTVNSGTFTINPDGTCSSKMSLAGREASIDVKATYTQDGATLTMKWAGAGTTAGTVEGSTFTMTNEGMVFAYRK